jgi:hypothetical protein
MGLALLGQDILTSAAIRYQLRFQQDVNNLAFVVTFNFLTVLGFSCRQTFFKFPNNAEPFPVSGNAKTDLKYAAKNSTIK